MRLIPAIDLRAGNCVRLLHGDFVAETRYPFDPRDLLLSYRDRGVEWLHIVDLDGARDGNPGNRPVIGELAALAAVKLQVGGGLRNTTAIAEMLDVGIGRAVVGSAAVTQIEQVQAWLKHFGPEHLTLAFDVCIDDTGVPRVMTHGWQRQSEHSLWRALDHYAATDLKHVLCTDVSRDGALTGPNIGLYQEAVRRYPKIEWQASGGIRNAEDLHALTCTGVSAAVSGKALLEDLIPLEELQPFWPNA
jgi:phosphoribosylformimino-5-aminoimidazole carboxamide ribotide isomerase